MSALGAVGLMLLLAQPAMLLQPCAISRTWQRPLSSALSTAHHHLAVTVRPAITAVMQAEAAGAMDAEYAAEVTSAEPVSKAKAEPETEPETDPVAIEKQELKHQIADLERQLKSARGGLIEAQDSLKDAGEAGYMLLAADFERFRLRAKDEMGSNRASENSTRHGSCCRSSRRSAVCRGQRPRALRQPRFTRTMAASTNS